MKESTCRKGHPWTPENTRWETNEKGFEFRRCRECVRQLARERRATARSVMVQSPCVRCGEFDWQVTPFGTVRCESCWRIRQEQRRAGTRFLSEKARKRSESTRASRKKYPERSRARNRVQRAVRSGRLVRPDRCERCSIECRPEASHDDYDRPLEVEWLCRPCHAQKDKWMRSATA